MERTLSVGSVELLNISMVFDFTAIALLIPSSSTFSSSLKGEYQCSFHPQTYQFSIKYPQECFHPNVFPPYSSPSSSSPPPPSFLPRTHDLKPRNSAAVPPLQPRILQQSLKFSPSHLLPPYKHINASKVFHPPQTSLPLASSTSIHGSIL